jgi:hypothetical protein
MRRLLSILIAITGVVILAFSACSAEELFLKEGRRAATSFSSRGFDRPGETSEQSASFLNLPFGTYHLEGNFQLDLKKTSPIDIGKEKENVFSVQFSVRW